jgi:UDP:flavonoid glycosyltransferase YjiC (YdhE family)
MTGNLDQNVRSYTHPRFREKVGEALVAEPFPKRDPPTRLRHRMAEDFGGLLHMRMTFGTEKFQGLFHIGGTQKT